MTILSAKIRNREYGSTLGRMCGVVCVLSQIAVLLYWTDDYVVAVGLAVLAWSAGLGIRVPFRATLRSTTTYVAFGVLIVAKSVALPFDVDPVRKYINTPLAFDLALFCMLTQLGVLFGYVGRRIPIWFSVFSVITMLLLSDVTVHSRTERWFLLAADIVCVIVAALIFRLHRVPAPAATKLPHRGPPNGWIPHFASAFLAILIGGGTAVALLTYERKIDQFLSSSLGVGRGLSGRVGFSGDGNLASITNSLRDGSSTIRLRVFSDQQPGYLAGRTFSAYTGSKWVRVDPFRPVAPTDFIAFEGEASREVSERVISIAGPSNGRSLFELSASRLVGEPADTAESAAVVDDFEIWPNRNLPSALFRPHECNFVAYDTKGLQIDESGNVEIDKEMKGAPFTMYRVKDRMPAELTGQQITKFSGINMTREPELLRNVLEATTRKIVGSEGFDRLSTAEKCEAVERYFQANYKYSLSGLNLNRRDDKVVQFLRNYDFGHCEYFASSSALLLRHMGVPTRYVTGFVCQERNTVGGYWVARDSDAHAWVEAWDDDAKRWRVVEATPSNGVPEGSAPSAITQAQDAVRAVFRRWRASFQQRDIQQELTDRAADLLTPSVLLSMGCLAGVAAVVLAYRQRRGRFEHDLVDFHEALERMTNAVAARGFVRGESETLLVFCERLRDSSEGSWIPEAATWFGDYSRLRYRRSTMSAQQVETELKTLADRGRVLARSVRRREKHHLNAGAPSVDTTSQL